jgi:hypothetical protein
MKKRDFYGFLVCFLAVAVVIIYDVINIITAYYYNTISYNKVIVYIESVVIGMIVLISITLLYKFSNNRR